MNRAHISLKPCFITNVIVIQNHSSSFPSLTEPICHLKHDFKFNAEFYSNASFFMNKAHMNEICDIKVFKVKLHVIVYFFQKQSHVT